MLILRYTNKSKLFFIKIQVMKNKNLITASFIGLALSFCACQNNELSADELTVTQTEQRLGSDIESTDALMKVSTFSSNPVALTDAEKSGLYLMREEEKLAGDVYSFFNTKFNYRIFANISKSESVHSAAVLSLIRYFGLTDSAVATKGVFNDATLQSLYDKFTTEATTVNQALTTGAFIEEYDIADLKKLIAESSNADIKLVYGNLMRGSEFHLKSFTGVLKLRGVTYVPKILSAEEYQLIITKK